MASKYPDLIAVISSCTYITVILPFIYVCLLLKVRKELLLDSRSRFNVLLKWLRNGGVGGVKNDFTVRKRVIGSWGLGVEKGVF